MSLFMKYFYIRRVIRRRINMERRYLQCDICGDKWDITNTELKPMVNPGISYHNKRVREGVRQFKILRERADEDGRIVSDYIDLCDACYNKLDRFIFDITNDLEVGPNYNA